MAKILRKSSENLKTQFLKLSVSIGQKSIIHHYYIQNVVDEIQIRVYTNNVKFVHHFSQFISVKVKKILTTFQPQFREKLKQLRL